MKKSTTKKRLRTNWAKIDTLKDKEIDTSDIPEQVENLFKTCGTTATQVENCRHYSIGPADLGIVQDKSTSVADQN